MQVRVLLAARAILVLALFPALAGCASEQGEALDRADLAPPDAPPASLDWAAPEDAEIRPGMRLKTEAGECPLSFVYETSSGALFLGTTAYCVRDLGLGSLATVGESRHIAVLAYVSFQTMHEVGERDPNALEYNDLALYYLDRAARPDTSPALAGSAPLAVADGDAYAPGARLRLFAPTAAGSPWREAVVTGAAGEWALLAYGVTPGAPGELGGGVLDPEGRAVGVLVTLGVVPNPGANGIARLDTMLAYAAQHAQLDLALATP